MQPLAHYITGSSFKSSEKSSEDAWMAQMPRHPPHGQQLARALASPRLVRVAAIKFR